jgi:hypothetical protein
MSQASNYSIANATGAAVRSDLNNVFDAIVSKNSGATEPSVTYAYMWWADTATTKLNIRNGANSGWIEVGTLDQVGLNIVASKFPNVTTNVTLTSAQINDTVYLASGTKMVFFQAAAPTGWTQDTNHNDKALRCVSGAGGSSGGSTAFSTLAHSHTGTGGSTSLSIAQMPAHTHTFTAQQNIGGFTDNGGAPDQRSTASSSTTNSTGSGSGHNHSVTVGSTSISPLYIDVIVCEKD